MNAESSRRTRVTLAFSLVLGVLAAATAFVLVFVMLRQAQRVAESIRDAGGNATVASKLLDSLPGEYERYFDSGGFGNTGRMPLLPSVVAVDLSKEAAPRELLEKIPSLVQLRFLFLRSQPGVSDALVQRFRRLRYLTDLRLSETPISGASVNGILDCKGLVRLELDGTNIDDEAVSSLATLPHLTILSLNDTPVTDAGIIAFGSRRNGQADPLTFLWLSRTRITDSALQALGGLGLKQLDLTGCAITDAGIRSMEPKAFDTLGRIILTGTQVTDACLSHLATLPSLKMVEARQTAVTRDAAAPYRARSMVIVTSAENRDR